MAEEKKISVKRDTADSQLARLKGDSETTPGKNERGLSPQPQEAPVGASQRASVRKGEDKAEQPPELEIVLTEEVGFESFNSMLTEVDEETVNKLKPLLQDEVTKGDDGDIELFQEDKSTHHNPLNTQWVDELLSDIVLEESADKKPDSVAVGPMKETPAVKQAVKESAGALRSERIIGASQTSMNKSVAAVGPFVSDTVVPAKSGKGVGSVTPKEMSEEYWQPELEPLAHRPSQAPHATIDGLAAELAEIKDMVVNLRIELDEIMNIQTRVLKVVLDICERTEREEPPDSMWKRLTDLTKKR